MRSKMMLALVAGLWSGAVFAADCAPDALRIALTTRADADQAARKAVIADLSDKAAHDRAMRTDHDNTAWMHEVVAQCGWPKRSAVGDDAATFAWLLVQHADMDPDFQVVAARAMKDAVLEREADGERLALLVDRNRFLDQLPQVYGTNTDDTAAGTLRFRDIVNPASLDARRAEIGLTPFYCHALALAKKRGLPLEWPQGVLFVPAECPDLSKR